MLRRIRSPRPSTVPLLVAFADLVDLARRRSAESGTLSDGAGWYAAVEGIGCGPNAAPDEDPTELRYMPVIKWERYTDGEGNPQIRAWFSSSSPIPSDRFHEVCKSYFINHYVHGLPESAKGKPPFIWA